MTSQHIIGVQAGGEGDPPEGTIGPLDLPELKLLSQEVQADGSIEAHVIARRTREACPWCSQICVKVHETRMRVKRDIHLRTYQVRLVVYKRRFRCLTCQRSFTEPDTMCGGYKRTTKRLRDHLAKQALHQPIAHVAEAEDVGPRFVQECLEAHIQEPCVKEGRTLEETAPLPTPRFLGIDEFARRKGHHYDTILCDLGNRTVLEISEGRKLEEVQKVLERLSNPDAVEAVSMDRSASFRPAVQLCLPKAHIVVDHFHVMQHVSDPRLRRLCRVGHTKRKGNRFCKENSISF